jgi:hypothetical protein
MGGTNGSDKLGKGSGSFYLNGQPLSSSTVGKNRQSTSVTLDPNLSSALTASNAGLANTVNLIGQNLGTTDAERNAYTQELYKPVASQINTTYDNAQNTATQRFNAQGGLNSVGFNRFQLGTVEKGRNQALQNAMDSANVESYGLASQKLQPILQALQAYQGTGNNIMSQALSAAGLSNQGQQQSLNYNQLANSLSTPSYFQSLFSPQAIQGQINSLLSGAGQGAAMAAM